MAAPKGNRFWEARASHGRNTIFENSDKLWEGCLEYMRWVEDNPLWEEKPMVVAGKIQYTQIPKMRAMTIGGLCIFLNITRSTWREYKKRDDFSSICEQVEEMIRDQKISGAAANMLNAAIIAREVGLAEKTESHVVTQSHEEWLKSLDDDGN